MSRFIILLLLTLGIGHLFISVVEAQDHIRDTHSQLFLFRVLDRATWELEENPLTKGKSMDLCVSVAIFDQPPKQPVGSGKVCLSGQDKNTEALSLWGLTLYMNFSFTTKERLVLSIPEATVVHLTKATATRSGPIVIYGASRKGTNAVLSGTGKFQDAYGIVEAFGVLETLALEPKESVSKYPFLGDIPILGALFHRTGSKK